VKISVALDGQRSKRVKPWRQQLLLNCPAFAAPWDVLVIGGYTSRAAEKIDSSRTKGFPVAEFAATLGKICQRVRYFSPLFQLTISRPEHNVPQQLGFPKMLSRLRALSLFALIAVVAMLTLPRIDLPETAFDETDSPTIQTILTSKASSFQQFSPLGAAIVPMAYAGMAKARVRNISPVYAAQSSESRQSQSTSILRC
jgi:hypothetical protein